MKLIARHSTGFVYYVSMKGVTGTAITVTDDLREQVEALRRVASPLPVGVGFGIQTPEHVAEVATVADAVVVGSALVSLIDKNQDEPDLIERAGDFVRSLKSAL